MSDPVCCCTDPTDVTLFVLKRLQKCVGGDAGFVLYMSRAVIGLCLSVVEAIVLVSEVLEDSDYRIAPIMVILGLFIVSVCTLGYMGGGILRDGLEEDDKRRLKNRFLLVFKFLNLVFASGILVRIIIDWEAFAIEDTFKDPEAAKVFVVVGLGMDLVMDPVELIFALLFVCQ